MEMTLEVIVVPVSDVQRATDFYADTLGFTIDHDTRMGDDLRVVQLTPPGSGCSIVLMSQGQQMEPGTMKGLQLVVPDLRSVHAELAGRGVEVGEIQFIGAEGQRAATDEDQLDSSGFVFFPDPDGNGWAIQQISESLTDRTAAPTGAEGPSGAP